MKYDWPGWRLKDNPYGEDFDFSARRRMVGGSLMILPYLKKYGDKLGDVILEVGPFFNPLINKNSFSDKTIIYWENDKYVLKWLREKKQKGVYPFYCDLNRIEGPSFLNLKIETEKILNELGKKKGFDSVVVSHVLNYIDYKLFFIVIKDFLRPGGLLFINNVVDYGLPVFFSSRKPKSNSEVIKTFNEIGYNVIEKKEIESPYLEHQKNKRLIIVAKNKK